jgi:hypothetical protein
MERTIVDVIAARRLIFLSMIFCLAELCACSKEVDPSRLAGTYEAHHRNGTEIIELSADGTYTHKFVASDGVNSTYSNNWKFERFDGEPKIALEGFTSHFPESEKSDVVLLGVERNWGRIRLYRSYALDQYYAKSSLK